MSIGICTGRWRIGLGAAIAASVIAIGLVSCTSAPTETEIRTKNPLFEFEGKWRRETPPGPGVPLPGDWTPDGQHNLCFTHKGKEYCVTLCVATNPDTSCVYIKHGDCDEGAGWIKYCPIVPSGNELLAASNCVTTVATISHNPLTGQTAVDITVACSHWVDEDLIDVFIAHPSAPSTFLDSETFRIVYGDYMPAGSRVQFSGDMEETAWNAALLKVDTVAFTTTTGDDVVSAIMLSGNTLPAFAVTVLNEQIVDVRAVHDPR